MLRLWAAALLLWGVDSFTPAFPNARSVGQQMSLHSTLYGNRIETAGLTVPMLKEVCKAKGLKVSGSRDELINRLAVVGADSGSNSKAVVEENKQEAKARRLKRTSAKVEKRRTLIAANQEMLRRQRFEKKVMLRGAEPVAKMEKDPNLRLEHLKVGQWLKGTVVRLVGHGAWVDVGSQVDGFVHVSAISEGFVHAPQDALTPGQAIDVCVKRADDGAKRLNLSCLELTATALEARGAAAAAAAAGGGAAEGGGKGACRAAAAAFEGMPAFEELAVDQEVRGEVTRVTHFGAFVECGLEKEAFLHVNDWPPRLLGQWAPECFSRGQRVVAHVKEVDEEYHRLKLTGHRPKSLPFTS